MYSKILITGTIETVTGMHIGGSNDFSAIGAIDSPVIKDSKTRQPMIPGSSLKGKLRSLLARQLNATAFVKVENDDDRIKRIFGSANGNKATPSRFIFTDAFLSNSEEILNMGADSTTEVKFENGINRQTGVANPRQIERVVRGAEFPLEIIYDAYNEEEIAEDFSLIADAMKLMQYDYIGGSGSRGYGKIKFVDINVECIVGDIDDDIIDECSEILKDVEK